jgi:hypothetical protein
MPISARYISAAQAVVRRAGDRGVKRKDVLYATAILNSNSVGEAAKKCGVAQSTLFRMTEKFEGKSRGNSQKILPIRPDITVQQPDSTDTSQPILTTILHPMTPVSRLTGERLSDDVMWPALIKHRDNEIAEEMDFYKFLFQVKRKMRKRYLLDLFHRIAMKRYTKKIGE